MPNQLFYANVDILGQDAGTIFVGATSLDEANLLLNQAMWDDAYEDVSYIGDLKKLPIPYAISDERVIATLGNTSDLFCCEGEDWLSQEMGRVNREFLREYALENAQERSRQTFLDREMPYLVVA